jgi:YebC/PmpR family DNA-binding regulatory protein
VAVKEGGADPDGNARLRMALNNARGANMPKDNIQRALSRAKDTDALHELSYEGYAPHGIAVFIECLTDNPQRTVGNIRAIFNKRGGNLGTNGSVAFMFDRRGIIRIPKGSLDGDELQMEIIDAGVEDFEEQDDEFVVSTSLEGFAPVQKQLEELGIEVENAELQRIPVETKMLDTETGIKVLKMIELFEDDDDVQNVFHNMEITDEMMDSLDA